MDIKEPKVAGQKNIGIFCCYARKDQSLFLDLKAHLMPIQQEGLITLWADVDINAGAEWEDEIQRHLNTAQIILLLVSPAFMTSNYCYSTEMKRAMERHEQGEAHVIPIILRPVIWQGAPFGKLQALPEEAKPITLWDNLDAALENVARGVQKRLHSEKDTINTKDVEVLLSSSTSKTKAQYLDEGYAFKSDKRYEEALVAFEQALSLDPHDAGAWYNKGETLYNLKHYEEALAAYEQVIQLQPNYLVAYLAKGWLLYDLKRFQEAFDSYDQAIQRDPYYAVAYNDKSVLLRSSRRYFQALEASEEAIRLKPNYTYAHLNKGLVLDDLGRQHEALAAFDQAIQHDPNYARAYYEKARVLKNIGRTRESRQAYEKAKQLGHN